MDPSTAPKAPKVCQLSTGPAPDGAAKASTHTFSVDTMQYTMALPSATPETQAWAAKHDVAGLCKQILQRLHQEMPADVAAFLEKDLYAFPLKVEPSQFQPKSKPAPASPKVLGGKKKEVFLIGSGPPATTRQEGGGGG